MTNQEFIKKIAGYVQKYAPQYGIKCCSAIIAQAINESGWGKSKLAAQYHNYFGLKCGTKWKGPSVNMTTQEEYQAGTLTTIKDNFRVYSSMEEGVKGYFEFIQLDRYKNLRGITDPEKYLQTIKNDGYATSSTYVQNNMALVNQYNLTQYDGNSGGGSTMSKIEKAVQQMEAWANDNSHGYDQIYRWGEKGDFDCSAAVIQACENAGIPVKSNGATYTGNMLSVFKKCGFKDVTSSVNLSTGSGLKRGDVLLNTSHHTAMYCGNGKEVEASINEKGTATGGKPGDQTGKEFLIRSYRNYPWTNVLRYQDGTSGSGSSGKKTVSEIANEVIAGVWGNGDARKNALEAAGYNYSEVQAAVNAKLSGSGTTTSKKSNAEIAKEVIAGKWGNGTDRKKKLEAADYNYMTIQAEVNKQLGKSGSSAGTSGGSSRPSYSVGKTYTLLVDAVRVRKGAGTGNAQKTYSQLTANAKANAYSNGCLKKGTEVTCQAVQNVGNDVWIKIPSGWIAAYYSGKKYVG